jgi:deoxyribodipyrimidine photo-lyase
MILPTLQELGLEFSEIDSRARFNLKEEKRQQCRIKSLFFETKNLSIKKLEMEWYGRSVLSKFSVWLAMGCIT